MVADGLLHKVVSLDYFSQLLLVTTDDYDTGLRILAIFLIFVVDLRGFFQILQNGFPLLQQLRVFKVLVADP